MRRAEPKRSKLLAYFEQAGARAAARKHLPGWLLLLMPILGFICMFGSAGLVAWAGLRLRNTLYPGAPIADGPGPLLVLFGSLIGAAAPGLMIGNAILWLFPPIRNIFERNATGVPGASFRAALCGLVRLSRYTVPAGTLILLLGFVSF